MTKKKSVAPADPRLMPSEPEVKKTKKHERKLRVRDASEIAKFLTLNAVSFKVTYNGNAKCIIKVDEENKKLFDDLIERLES